jgi:hypothetical protein
VQDNSNGSNIDYERKEQSVIWIISQFLIFLFSIILTIQFSDKIGLNRSTSSSFQQAQRPDSTPPSFVGSNDKNKNSVVVTVSTE